MLPLVTVKYTFMFLHKPACFFMIRYPFKNSVTSSNVYTEPPYWVKFQEAPVPSSLTFLNQSSPENLAGKCH